MADYFHLRPVERQEADRQHQHLLLRGRLVERRVAEAALLVPARGPEQQLAQEDFVDGEVCYLHHHHLRQLAGGFDAFAVGVDAGAVVVLCEPEAFQDRDCCWEGVDSSQVPELEQEQALARAPVLVLVGEAGATVVVPEQALEQGSVLARGPEQELGRAPVKAREQERPRGRFLGEAFVMPWCVV